MSTHKPAAAPCSHLQAVGPAPPRHTTPISPNSGGGVGGRGGGNPETKALLQTTPTGGAAGSAPRIHATVVRSLPVGRLGNWRAGLRGRCAGKLKSLGGWVLLARLLMWLDTWLAGALPHPGPDACWTAPFPEDLGTSSGFPSSPPLALISEQEQRILEMRSCDHLWSFAPVGRNK